MLQDLLIPLVEEKKEKEVPRLPFIGNVASILTFLLACIQSLYCVLLQDFLIPLVEEKREKEVPRLPFIGNVASILTFLLACKQSILCVVT